MAPENKSPSYTAVSRHDQQRPCNPKKIKHLAAASPGQGADFWKLAAEMSCRIGRVLGVQILSEGVELTQLEFASAHVLEGTVSVSSFEPLMRCRRTFCPFCPIPQAAMTGSRGQPR